MVLSVRTLIRAAVSHQPVARRRREPSPVSKSQFQNGVLPVSPAVLAPFRAGPVPDTILPEYGGLGLGNVVPSVERFFGVETDIAPLAESVLPPAMLDGARRIVTLVIDALGANQLRGAMGRGHAPYLAGLIESSAAHLGTLTSTFPSTTVCALTTLGTGLPPGRHGVTSQYIYDAGLGTVVDILRFAPAVAGRELDRAGVDPAEWIGVPSIHQTLAARGVPATVVNHAQFEGTSLSKINHRGAAYRGFATISDLCVNLRAVLESPPERAYVHAYWGTLDSITHQYGAHSPQHDAEVRVIDHALGEILLRGLRAPGTLLMLLADHGHIDTRPDEVLWLNDHPELLPLLQAPPAGLDRAAVLYSRAGCEDEVRGYAERNLAEYACVLSADESIALDLYGPGPLSPRARARIGQLLLLPRDAKRIRYQHPGQERKVRNIGNHGGLTPGEMLIPLIALRLD